jgi:UDP-N-acetylmuramate dehydrogenase
MSEKTGWNPDYSAVTLQKEFGDRLKTDQPLADLNTFGTGGHARFFMEVRSAEELSALIKAASRLSVPYFMLGGGSNVLVSDSGYDGLIIRNSIMGLEISGDSITSGAGEKLQALVDFATDGSLSGLEFASGIWGTVGGAVYGNAGAYGSDIGSALSWAELVDKQGNVRVEKADYFEFDYRSSKLKQTGEFITRVNFALKAGKRETIQQRIDEIMSLRIKRLPIGERSAGCFFKNIPDNTRKFGKLSSGKLLEEIGAKNMRYGGARVFKNHANIIINSGTAKSADIRRLANLLKARVKEKFGINLQEEVIFLGEFKEDIL